MDYINTNQTLEDMLPEDIEIDVKNNPIEYNIHERNGLYEVMVYSKVKLSMGKPVRLEEYDRMAQKYGCKIEFRKSRMTSTGLGTIRELGDIHFACPSGDSIALVVVGEDVDKVKQAIHAFHRIFGLMERTNSQAKVSSQAVSGCD